MAFWGFARFSELKLGALKEKTDADFFVRIFWFLDVSFWNKEKIGISLNFRLHCCISVLSSAWVAPEAVWWVPGGLGRSGEPQSFGTVA